MQANRHREMPVRADRIPSRCSLREPVYRLESSVLLRILVLVLGMLTVMSCHLKRWQPQDLSPSLPQSRSMKREVRQRLSFTHPILQFSCVGAFPKRSRCRTPAETGLEGNALTRRLN